MSEYELQFQADLERAQALSLESLALEEFRKRRNHAASPSYESELDGPLRPSRSGSVSGSCPPLLPPPPRPCRPMRRPKAAPRSSSSSPTPHTEQEAQGHDLISFTSPASTNKAHLELKECIDHIHRLNQQPEQLALVPVPKSGTKLTRSNSSVSTYSNNSQSIIPYPTQPPTSNAVNPLIAYPSNSPFVQVQYHYSPTTPNYYSSHNNGYQTPAGITQTPNNKYQAGVPNNGIGFASNYQRYSSPASNDIYPNLANISLAGLNPATYQYSANMSESAAKPLAASPSVYPNLNTYTSDTNKNISPVSFAPSAYSTQSIKTSLSAQSLSSVSSKSLSTSTSAQNLMNETVEKNKHNMPNSQKSDFNVSNLPKSNSSDVIKSRDEISNSSHMWDDTFDDSTSFQSCRSTPKGTSDVTYRSSKPNTSRTAYYSPGSPSTNLIDLAANTSTTSIGSVRVSVLEAFDPLIADQNTSEYMCSSECSGSVYDEYDPLDFLYSGNETLKDTPVYATVNRRANNESLPSPLPSPPPKAFPSTPAVVKRSNTLNSKLYECFTFAKTRKYEPDLQAFLQMVKDVRAEYVYSDPVTNPGCVIAAKSDGQYPLGTSIKLLVYHQKPVNPITFTCDVESTVEHVILHVVCELEGEIKEDTSMYTLRVWGMGEYLTPGSCLKEYDYIRQCVRLEKDILLCLQSTKDTSLARTERDDTRDNLLTLEELLPNQGSVPPISHHNLSILLETLEKELSKLTSVVSGAGLARAGATAQAVKAVCALLGGVETVHVSTALANLMHACSQVQPDSNIMKAEIVSESGEYCNVSLRQATLKDTIGLHCQRLREAVKGFIAIYCRSNRVDFQIEENQYSTSANNESPIPLSSVAETALVCVEGVHRPPLNWHHDEFTMHAQVYHGTRPLKGSRATQPCPLNTHGFYPRIMFETWLLLDEIAIANLPKESRLVLTLNGRTLSTPDSQNTASAEKDKAAEANQKEAQEKQDDDDEDDDTGNLVHMQQEELGWASIQLFDFTGSLVSGSFILPLWPMSADKRLGPAPDLSDNPLQAHPVVHIEIPSYSNGGVRWQDDEESEVYTMSPTRHSFDALDAHTQQQLLHLVEQGPYQRMPSECREILWEKRHYLIGIPAALPLVVLASMSWDAFSRRQLLQLLDQWKTPSPHDALHLLLPCFPDEGVRLRAVRWLSLTPADALCTLAPQLCSALRYERHAASPLARLLLRRALDSPRFAHKLYWQLVHDIPGNSPQNSADSFLGISLDGEASVAGAEVDAGIIASSRWVRRNQMLLRALLAILGENLSQRLLKQQLLVKSLTEIAGNVKNSKESVRNRNLISGVEGLVPLLKSDNVCLPLSISREVHGVDVKSCSYFPSNTLPMKINFISVDNAVVPAIFKVGDDLRQDALVLQVMRVMDQLWLKEGLDLRMVTFDAVPTQLRKGMIEMVCSAETLRAIQVEWGLTGSFKDKPIAEWLAKHNPSELEYERAVTNFTASCAGYSVATYLLGICDRHNDNIMLKTSGHLFHIDFGKFLGDAQMFGNFKRDRAPFVLTPDMAYVINGGERPSQRFHHFVELCCTAFNIVRKHHNLILHLFSLMASTGIPGVSATAVGYVRAALLPGQTAAEAAAAFARLIHSALRSRFTPINFFLHNLAQLRAGDQPSSSSELLSFMPKTYTMSQEGRLTNVEVLGYEKRYDPEKYYVYALRIFRQGQATSVVLYRSYKHFTELYQKICLHFPLAKVHSLPVGLHMGRSNTKQAANRRYKDVQAFLTSLFQLADEIAHSDLVYTFFHPLLRDQQDVGPQRIKNKRELHQQNDGDGVGALKISIQYCAGVLSVLILHAQSLPMIMPGVPPSPYVKVYLVPDPSKETKRKTRVLKRNCHPSFMEMLEYRLPMEVIRGRELKATVWHHDPLQENQFLGGVQLPLHSMQLTAETTEWYTLKCLTR